LLVLVVGYDHKEYLEDNVKYIINNPADEVLNANIPEEEILCTFKSETYGEIILQAGVEENYGLRHILARHTTNFFINFDDKNNSSMFYDEITGKELLLGLDEFVKHCVDVPKYSNNKSDNLVYIGFTKIGGERIKCLLIVMSDTKSIVTFYPFEENTTQDLPEPIYYD